MYGHSLLIPLSGLIAATLVLAADAAAQLALPPSAGYGELPIGTVTALIGGPVFILLARRVTTGDADRGAAVSVAQPRKSRFAGALALGSSCSLRRSWRLLGHRRCRSAVRCA
ncbi:hypothetical protein DMH04_01580 [Kibdelosporangium aridum]|uniref:FecCD transport family protein n=1 Tax=Kibdelosporangium aridum TaxID=2030 RepID=A0A428ZUJ5_KIBAR|nr:hypothetical protein DMH04_01580 [Kibdelosporangium aridum]